MIYRWGGLLSYVWERCGVGTSGRGTIFYGLFA